VIKSLDSYWTTIVNRMATVDSTQRFGGFIDSRDWPMTAPIEGALYLLFLQAVPVGGTESQIFYQYICQWSWLLIGENISATEQESNRGNRRRENMKIIDNLRQANYPSWCEKKSYTANTQTGVISSASVRDGESLWWSRLRFIPRADNDKSGLIYGVATFQLYSYDDVLAAIA
jgi:hypothetical protein